MSRNRSAVVFGLIGILGLNLLIWWWRNWGLISLDAQGMPYGKVLDSFRRQGGVAIASNIAPETPITLRLRRVPVTQAIDALAGQVGASWSLAFVLAPDENGVKEGLQVLGATERPQGWSWVSRGLPMMIDLASAAPPPDPRKAKFDPDPPVEPAPLSLVSGRLAEASEVSFLFKSDWDPQVNRPPKPGVRLPRAVGELAKSLPARVKETFVILDRGGMRGERGGPPGEGRDGGRDGRRGGFGPPQAEDAKWIERRVEQRIAALPKAEQAEAREEWKSERQFWEGLRDLSPEERRQKMEEHFNDPNFQERMDERMARREARSSPERRRERYRHYLERRAQSGPKGGSNRSTP